MNKNPDNKQALTAHYTIVKDCFLGSKNTEIALNARQADNLLAGGFIVVTKKNKEAK